MPDGKTILVTGASGYIAKHLILRLLQAGYAVRASVLNAARAQAVREAMAARLAADFPLGERLAFVELDLTREAGWPQALSGVDALLHTASPFPLEQPRDAQEVVRPAVEGTLRALKAARDAGVTKVVLTGSVASIINREIVPGRPFDEQDWTDPGFQTVTPYALSKYEAERAVWKFAGENPQMRITVINPGFVLGAPLDADFGTSVSVIERILRGRDPMLPDIAFPCVDVGDVAAAHITALEHEEASGKRFAVAASVLTFADMAAVLKREFPSRRIPTRVAPGWFIRLLGRFDKGVASIVPALGRREPVSSERARTLLGIVLRDPRESVAETGRWLAEHGV